MDAVPDALPDSLPGELPDELPGDLVPVPDVGRRFRTSRRVRLGDADQHGRLRLDALARLLQDVGNDDFADAGLDPATPWVARRTVVWSPKWPRLGDRVEVTTFCGGIGSRWGERRSSLRSADGTRRIEVASVWVFLGEDADRPTRLPNWFLDTYAEAALGRTVDARLRHPAPPAGAPSRPWPLRSSDLDVLRHVNNAATWQAVEDEAARRGVVPGRAELEYGAAIEPTDEVELVSVDERDGFRLWLVVDGSVRASAVVRVA
ncbi:MAG: acyl-ACP thioesterase domain-containing protein [Acidimicrobiales bacterium]